MSRPSESGDRSASFSTQRMINGVDIVRAALEGCNPQAALPEGTNQTGSQRRFAAPAHRCGEQQSGKLHRMYSVYSAHYPWLMGAVSLLFPQHGVARRSGRVVPGKSICQRRNLSHRQHRGRWELDQRLLVRKALPALPER